MHARSFESGADYGFAARLHHSGGSAQALGVESRVAHTLLVVPQEGNGPLAGPPAA